MNTFDAPEDFAKATHEAFAHLMAGDLLRDDADLGDERAVILCLVANRYEPKKINLLMDRAIEIARSEKQKGN